MKRSILVYCLAICFGGTGAYSQESTATGRSGVVTYEETVKMEIKLEGEAARLIKDLPTERKAVRKLTFTTEASTYTTAPSATPEPDRRVEADGFVFVARSYEPENIIHTDLKKKKVTEMREFMTRMFLIDRAFTEINWKITGEQKEIAGFVCMEATRADTAGRKTAVWFTPQIEIAAGPALFNNMPGMVLEVNENDGQRIITAKSVEFTPINTKDLAKPSEGKKVTAEEFDEIVKEKMKEMGAEGSGGGTVRVVIRNQEQE